MRIAQETEHGTKYIRGISADETINRIASYHQVSAALVKQELASGKTLSTGYARYRKARRGE